MMLQLHHSIIMCNTGATRNSITYRRVQPTQQQNIEYYCLCSALLCLTVNSILGSCLYSTFARFTAHLSTRDHHQQGPCARWRHGGTLYGCGCHGLHVDTGRWVDTKREDRLYNCLNRSIDMRKGYSQICFVQKPPSLHMIFIHFLSQLCRHHGQQALQHSFF